MKRNVTMEQDLTEIDEFNCLGANEHRWTPKRQWHHVHCAMWRTFTLWRLQRHGEQFISGSRCVDTNDTNGTLNEAKVDTCLFSSMSEFSWSFAWRILLLRFVKKRAKMWYSDFKIETETDYDVILHYTLFSLIYYRIIVTEGNSCTTAAQHSCFIQISN